MGAPLRIVVLGMMGRSPYGGQTWLFLNWLSGFKALGHDVWYVEDDLCWPYDPVQDTVTDDCSYAVRHIRSSLERIGLGDRWAYRFGGADDRSWGLAGHEIDALYRSCDALLNLTGSTVLRDEHLVAPRRVLLETDPVISELKLASGDERTRAYFDSHDLVVTYGENYGAPDCGVPLERLRYRKTRQPVDLTLWPVAADADAPHFTTIGNYRQDGHDVVYRGEMYRWSKHWEWEKIIELPRHTAQTFELAVKVEERDDLDRLLAHGWRVVSPIAFSRDIFGAYPAYIRASRAELTVAKDQNVRLRSGWFSDRDACYLASGKPVVAQDTGFGATIPVGEGLFAFRDLQGALAAVDAINTDYARHAKAARAIAEAYFEARRVANAFVRTIGLG